MNTHIHTCSTRNGKIPVPPVPPVPADAWWLAPTDEIEAAVASPTPVIKPDAGIPASEPEPPVPSKPAVSPTDYSSSISENSKVQKSANTRCIWCGSDRLVDTGISICCEACERRVWEFTDNGGLIRPGFEDFDDISPDEVPVCPRCKLYCDTESAMGTWRCSRCGPATDVRRRRVAGFMRRRDAILRRTRGVIQ